MRRINLVFLAFCLAFIAILSRLFYWQILASEKLAIEAQKQYGQKNIIFSLRGEIKANDNATLVTNQTAYLVYVNPKKIKIPPGQLADQLAPIFLEDKITDQESTESSKSNFDKKDIMEKEIERIKKSLSKTNLEWIALKHKVEKTSLEKIKSLGIEGVDFEEESKRFYPESSMAAHLLGFVGSDANGEDKGYFGLEGFYDYELKGRSGFTIAEKDARGAPIILGGTEQIEAINGRNMILHLDRTVQFIVEKKLREAVIRYGAKEGSVAIMDPKTGGIIALSNFPSYAGGNWQSFDSGLYKNPFIADTFEPGSIFKTFVMAAALNENAVKPETICNKCSGPRIVNDFTIKTWNSKYYPGTSMTEVLEHSDNVGMVFVGEKLGGEKLISYLQNFGFGQPTGIDLEEETNVPLRPKNEWRPIDLATVTFGQGIAVTGIQTLTAVAAIANGGKLFKPHVVARIQNDNGSIIEIKPKLTRQVIKPATSKVLTEMMVNAVDKGEARFAKPKGYRIAGKTGTAQIPIAGHYDPTKTIASFIGFAPADDPKFVMLTILREPTSSPWGSETAAPLFFDITKELFTYYKIAPEP